MVHTVKKEMTSHASSLVSCRTGRYDGSGRCHARASGGMQVRRRALTAPPAEADRRVETPTTSSRRSSTACVSTLCRLCQWRSKSSVPRCDSSTYDGRPLRRRRFHLTTASKLWSSRNCRCEGVAQAATGTRRDQVDNQVDGSTRHTAGVRSASHAELLSNFVRIPRWRR